MRKLIAFSVFVLLAVSIFSIGAVATTKAPSGELTEDSCPIGCIVANFFKDLFQNPTLTGQAFNVADCPSGMVSYWEGEGDATDSLDGNNGTLFGNTAYVPGIVGQAFSFDGSGDYVEVADSANLDLSNGVTVEGWMKRSSSVSYESLFVKDEDSTYKPNYIIDIASGKLRFFGYEGSSAKGITSLGSPVLSAGIWYHVAGTFDGTEWKIYLDGQEVSSEIEPAVLSTTNYPFRLGRRGDVANVYFNGLLDEVAVYDRALDWAEILDHYNAGVGKNYCEAAPVVEVCPTGMTSYWEAEGDATDSFDGNDGTLVGGISFAPGIVGDAFSLDGVDDYVDIPGDPSLSGLNEVTIEAWINSNVLSGSNPLGSPKSIVSKYDSLQANKVEYYLAQDKNDYSKLLFATNDGSWHSWATLNPVMVPGWMHVVVTYDGISDPKFYINGVFEDDNNAGTPVPMAANNQNVQIGSAVLGGVQSAFFDGIIDEVAIYGGVLDAAEILDHYNAGVGKSYCQPISSVCGDGIIDAPYEVCEGGNLNGQTCQTRGFGGGTLACSANCLTFDTSGCFLCVPENDVNVCWDTVDNDCDGLIDGGDPDCAPGSGGQTLGLCSVAGDLNNDGVTNILDVIIDQKLGIGFGALTVGAGCERNVITLN